MTRSRRYEFSTATKREAVRRAAGRCEAVGSVYGLEPGQRCNGDLGRGLEIDHYPIPATEKGGDTLENAVVCCLACHRWKTSTFDVPVQAKVKRVADRNAGIRPKPRLQGRGFQKSPPQRTASRPIVRRSERTPTL